MNLECPKCGHSWNYKGNTENKERVTCPKCFCKVKLDKTGQIGHRKLDKTQSSISADLMQGSVSVVLARSWLQSKATTVNQFNSSHKTGKRKEGISGCSEPLPDSYRSIAKFLS